jgi:hypothetical protein
MREGYYPRINSFGFLLCQKTCQNETENSLSSAYQEFFFPMGNESVDSMSDYASAFSLDKTCIFRVPL